AAAARDVIGEHGGGRNAEHQAGESTEGVIIGGGRRLDYEHVIHGHGIADSVGPHVETDAAAVVGLGFDIGHSHDLVTVVRDGNRVGLEGEFEGVKVGSDNGQIHLLHWRVARVGVAKGGPGLELHQLEHIGAAW